MVTDIEHLLNKWREGNLSDEQLRRLTQALEKRQAREALRDDWFLESSLPEALRASPVLNIELPPDEITSPLPIEASRWTHWLSWRPLTAAAAGIVFGMLCTSLVFGHSNPRIVQQMLILANAGFEEQEAPLPDGIPLHFGVWSGDFSEIVGEQRGITPHEGKRMFRFLRSDSKDGFPARAYHGNMYQFIDIKPWRDAIASGTAVVDWSAWFNCISEPAGTPSQFEASMWAFAGDPSCVRRNWEEKLHQELGYSTWRVVADQDPNTWQRVTGSLIVPPDTDFLVVEIKAIAGNETPANGVVAFSGHYADDVQMVLRTNAREHPQKLTRLVP